jgi:hypothetical protein
VHCTRHNDVIDFKDQINEAIYACMEMSKQSYVECQLMPMKRLQDYMKWKDKLEREKQKQLDEEASQYGKSFK